ncbi:Uncharacterised protein [Klebsiella pneumoniae]|nr:Uncharacterised protein [Klebsiella pneumoniae]
MSYLTTEGRLYFLSLTRPVTHLCYNISYNTIYYYIIVRCYLYSNFIGKCHVSSCPSMNLRSLRK